MQTKFVLPSLSFATFNTKLQVLQNVQKINPRFFMHQYIKNLTEYFADQIYSFI